jgi:hypothetical protein
MNRKAIDIGDYYADFGKIDKLLGWWPQVMLKDGLQQTLEYYRKNRAHYWNCRIPRFVRSRFPIRGAALVKADLALQFLDLCGIAVLLRQL